MTTPDEVAALVKRLRAEQQAFSQVASIGLTGNMPLAYAILAKLLGEAADALESLSPPAGMVMVPREPTKAMLDAGYAGAAFPRDPEICVAMWKAMLAAASAAGEKEKL